MPPVPKVRPKRPTFLRAWREHRGLTQELAASRLGMDRTNLGKIERGLVPYSQQLLERAAEAYRCEPADLIMRDPKNEAWSLWDTVRRLPEAQQRQIAGMIEGFLKNTDSAGVNRADVDHSLAVRQPRRVRG